MGENAAVDSRRSTGARPQLTRADRLRMLGAPGRQLAHDHRLPPPDQVAILLIGDHLLSAGERTPDTHDPRSSLDVYAALYRGLGLTDWPVADPRAPRPVLRRRTAAAKSDARAAVGAPSAERQHR